MNIRFRRVLVLVIIAVSLVSNVYGEEKKEKKKKPKKDVNTITYKGKTITLGNSDKKAVNTVTYKGKTITLDNPDKNTITIYTKEGKKVISVKGHKDRPVQNPGVKTISNKNLKPAATPPNPGANVFMWKVESNGQMCYLLGSIHFLNSRHYPLHTTIESAFNKCDVLVVEADISGSAGISAATSAMHQAMYRDGRTLKGDVSSKTLDMVKQKLADMNLGVDYMMKFKPWFVAMTIMQYQLARLGYNADAGVDKYFLNKAAQTGIPVKELEGVNFQMNLFNSFSRTENEHFLLSTIVSTNKLQTQMTKMVNAWLTGDAPTMHQNNTSYLSQYPELLPMYKKLNDDRNVTMTQKIKGYMNSNKTHFVVVGAAHLIGPNGIVNLLRNNGYTVTQQ